MMGGRPATFVSERFWLWVDQTPVGPDGCWTWIGQRNTQGYGRLMGTKGAEKGHFVMAHRIAYEMLVGPIPDGLHIDHLCRNKSCVNPVHLEPVTLAENTRRAREALGIRDYATHCPQGHEYTPENTSHDVDDGPHRRCVACRKAYQRAYYLAHRSA